MEYHIEKKPTHAPTGSVGIRGSELKWQAYVQQYRATGEARAFLDSCEN